MATEDGHLPPPQRLQTYLDIDVIPSDELRSGGARHNAARLGGVLEGQVALRRPCDLLAGRLGP